MRTPEGVVLGHLPLRNKENKKIVGIFYPLDSGEYLGALNYRVGRKNIPSMYYDYLVNNSMLHEGRTALFLILILSKRC